MLAEPQGHDYRPDPAILTIAGWLGDPVAAAEFPQTVLRFRNDRAAASVGLAELSGGAWLGHFGRFVPLPGNLAQPLALRYHGHQFRVYNPDLGDGRGFLFAQLRDDQGRLLDLGTKGSGQTPWSRAGDGRLTLKGGVREVLATELLEALETNTSKTFSLIETGEALMRGDEPSPTRSAVLVRLSHGHIRIGSFQRLAALDETDNLAALVDYALATYPGAAPPAGAPGRDQPAAMFLHQVVERLTDMAASYMAAGFVHGVLNTDNMNISGESFDYGPWRWLTAWDPTFTAAYFDSAGLYAFGRQPEAIHWNCAQLAVALRPLCDAPPLIAALERFGPLYQAALTRRFLARLGLVVLGDERDGALIAAAEAAMRALALSPDAFFGAARGGGAMGDAAYDALVAQFAPMAGARPVTSEAAAAQLDLDEVERVWSAIAAHDDWSAFHAKVAAIRTLGAALAPG